MMRFGGPALEGIREAVGLVGAGAQFTEFPDGICDQVLDVGPFIRRGRTFAGSSGIFGAHLGVTHAGAGALSSTVDPYNPLATAGYVVGAGYPAVVPPGFDFWVLAASAFSATAASCTSARLRLSTPASSMGFGTISTSHTAYLLTFVQAIVAELATPQVMYRDVSGAVEMFPRIRVPRGSTLIWDTVATAAASHFCQLICALLPAGLGQDGIG